MAVQNRYESGRIISLIVTLLVLSILTPLGSPQASTSVWSGVVSFPDGVTIESNEVVQVSPGTEIRLGDGKSVDVKGRLTILGHLDDPVILNSIDGKHNGIRFLEDSRGLGSYVSNLEIQDNSYGISVWNSDPTLQNITIFNPDFVGMDLFSGSNPSIYNLTIEGGGQDVHGISNTWRYGIGLSVGSGSSPILDGLSASGLITRAVNVWGGSGGLLSNMSITNISGATIAVSTGIWVEDSVILIKNSRLNYSDNGVYVRHISEGFTTRPTLENIIISNSKYRGIMVEQYNRSKWNELSVNAIIRNTTVSGTGGPLAQTSGLGLAGLELNTSGAVINGLDLEGNHAPGLKAYMIDGSSKFQNVTSRSDGSRSISSDLADASGIYLRSANWPVKLHDISVSDSIGSGILLWKGGATGTNWMAENSGGAGIDIREFHPEVIGVKSVMNRLVGIQVIDSSNVRIEHANTSLNGQGAPSDQYGAGFLFLRSNDVVSSGKDVTCLECRSTDDRSGFSIIDSIDLQLKNISVFDPSSGKAILADGTGLQRPGYVEILGAEIRSNHTASEVSLQSIDGHLRDIDFSGTSFEWSAYGLVPSSIQDSNLNLSSNCTVFSNFPDLRGTNVSFRCQDGNPIEFTSSNTTMVDASIAGGSTLSLSSGSNVNWVSSTNISSPLSDDPDDKLIISWFIDVEVTNQNGFGIPFATVDLSFDRLQENSTSVLPYSGTSRLGPFTGKVWTPSDGWSQTTNVLANCSYIGYEVSMGQAQLNDDLDIICSIDLPNQAPFIVWETPLPNSVYGSSERVVFNAADSWDMDYDSLSFSWVSSIDGTLSSPSGGTAFFIANDPLNASLFLSDGEHTIELTVCDSTGRCSTMERVVTLLNLPPLMSVATRPEISPFGVMSLGMTANATIDLSGTLDPENDTLECWVLTSYGDNISLEPPCNRPHQVAFVPQKDTFTVTIEVSDGTNQPVSWAFTIDHYNQLPVINYEIIRSGPSSDDMMLISFLGTEDPEGDELYFSIFSDIQGLIWTGDAENGRFGWEGRLAKGDHTITLEAWDDNPENIGQSTSIDLDVVVTNSNSRSIIASPEDGLVTDSSEIIAFSALGSGDRDMPCSSFPGGGLGFLCSQGSGFNELVTVTWKLDGSSEILSTEWIFQSRLPPGTHIVRLTVDDGIGQASESTINVTINPSAPILVIDDPIEGQIFQSDKPVNFDLRESFDADGDEFLVTITSDRMPYPIANGIRIEGVYSQNLPSGEHNLTFMAVDTSGMVRTVNLTILITPTSPVPAIASPSDGSFIPPGQTIILDSFGTIDHDGDLAMIEWSLSDGTVIGNSNVVEVDLPPGPHIIRLRAIDSRGFSNMTAVSIMVGSSAPTISSLQISPSVLIAGNVQEIHISTSMVDLDGTTNEVSAILTIGGAPILVGLNDDGNFGDEVADDGVWSVSLPFSPEGGDWVRVDVWARDGDVVSSTLTETIPVDEQEGDSGLLAQALRLGSIGLLALLLLGANAALRRRSRVKADLAEIESWGAFREEDYDPPSSRGPNP